MVDYRDLPEVDINKIATDLNGKADTDLTNVTDTAKVMMSGMGMPSNKYINLTLGASDTRYTAPADGWYYAQLFLTSAANSPFGLRLRLMEPGTTSAIYTIGGFEPGEGTKNQEFGNVIKVKKGDTVEVGYKCASQYATGKLRFIYAVGSESEAS